MTGNDIVTRVRTILKSGSEVRWDDNEMLLWLNDGQRDIIRRRPDAQYLTSINADPIIDITALEDTMQLVEHFRITLTNYVMSRAYDKDAEYSNGRQMSSFWHDKYIRELV